jgi:hypothetical protein
MMGAALSLILTPVGKLTIFFTLLAAVALAGYVALKQHDAALLAQQNLVAQQAIAVEQAAHAQRTIATLQQENAQAMADVAAAGSIKRTISNAPNSSACAGSAPVGAALRGLQPAGGGHHAPAKASPSPVAVPAGASPAGPGN